MFFSVFFDDPQSTYLPINFGTKSDTHLGHIVLGKRVYSIANCSLHTSQIHNTYQIDFLFVVNVGFPVLPLFKTISF